MKKYTIIRRQNWTEEQSRILYRLSKSTKHTGQHKWQSISQILETKYQIYRNAQQCKERWQKFLNPKINREEWKEEQIKQLLNLHQFYGNKWKQIANQLQGRTDNDVKNKFYCAARKAFRRIYKTVTGENGTNVIEGLKCNQISRFLIGLHVDIRDIGYKILGDFSTENKIEFKIEELSPGESSLIYNFMSFITGQNVSSDVNQSRGHFSSSQSMSKKLKLQVDSQINDQNQLKSTENLNKTSQQSKNFKQLQSDALINILTQFHQGQQKYKNDYNNSNNKNYENFFDEEHSGRYNSTSRVQNIKGMTAEDNFCGDFPSFLELFGNSDAKNQNNLAQGTAHMDHFDSCHQFASGDFSLQLD